jgi:selenide,water dikinase
MIKLNSAGEQLGQIKGVTAMTDVTGFGLAGHLIEMCNASNTSAEIRYENMPIINANIEQYILDGCVPGGTQRNFDSYGKELMLDDPSYRNLVCDPQTSGGLLIAVEPDAIEDVTAILLENDLIARSIGSIVARKSVSVIVR